MFEFVKNWLYKPSSTGDYSDEVLPAETEEVGQDIPTNASNEEVTTGAANSSEEKVECLDLPLSSIYHALPPDLQSRVRLPDAGEAHVAVPLAMVLPQLGRGSVKLSFGELREMACDGIFYSQSDRDQAVVELPLPEILARINPTNLQRRSQQQVQISDEVTSPFESKGEGLNIYKPEPARHQTLARKVEQPSAVPAFPARGNIDSVPPLFTSKATPKIQPAAPIRVQPRTDTPPNTHMLVQAAAQASNGNGASLAVTMNQLATEWPETIRQEIIHLNLGSAMVSIPFAFAEDSLRKGRAIAPWKQIRSWTNQPVAIAAHSPQDAELIDLPLKVIAPLFLAKLSSGKVYRKVETETKIPDLFSGKNSPQSPAPIAHNPPAPAAPANFSPTFSQPPVPVVNLAEARGKARQSNTDLFIRSGTDFLKRYATPNDIVAKAGGLEGVEGALITLPDGLLVSSHLHGTVNGDTLAAFIPQLFGRASQSTREFRMGDLSQLNFIVGGTPWVVFKVGGIFFAAFGRSDVALPLEALKTLAAELDRKK